MNISRREDEETEEPKTPCPNCKEPLTESELDCISCKSHVPYCIGTGLHVIRDDFTTCPHCGFPGIYSRLTKQVSATHQCPMCDHALEPADLRPQDYEAYLKQFELE